MVVCRKPVLLEEIPRVLSNFTRAYTNKVFTRQPNVTAADALAGAVTPMFARETEPVVLQYGKAHVDVWAVSKPSSSAAALPLVPDSSDAATHSLAAATSSGATFASNLHLATPPSHLSMYGPMGLPLPGLPLPCAAQPATAPSLLSPPVFSAEALKPKWKSQERDDAVVAFITTQLDAPSRASSAAGCGWFRVRRFLRVEFASGDPADVSADVQLPVDGPATAMTRFAFRPRRSCELRLLHDARLLLG
jgi:hypothetical protein